jgi:hypothetical protein
MLRADPPAGQMQQSSADVNGCSDRQNVLKLVTVTFHSPGPGYWRPMAIRISLSLSVMRSPDRSTVTVCSTPVKRNGAW